MATDQATVSFTTLGGDVAGWDLTTNNGFTNVRLWVPFFPDQATGTITGTVRVPANYASGGKVIVRCAANATSGAYNIRVSTLPSANTESADGSYTAESFQSITTAATAKVHKDTTFTLTPTLAPGDTLYVKFERDGGGASGTDTLTVNLLLLEAVLEYTTT